METEAEAEKVLARLVDNCVEGEDQHKAIVAENEALQCAVRDNLRSSNQQPTVQSSKIIGCTG